MHIDSWLIPLFPSAMVDTVLDSNQCNDQDTSGSLGTRSLLSLSRRTLVNCTVYVQGDGSSGSRLEESDSFVVLICTTSTWIGDSGVDSDVGFRRPEWVASAESD